MRVKSQMASEIGQVRGALWEGDPIRHDAVVHPCDKRIANIAPDSCALCARGAVPSMAGPLDHAPDYNPRDPVLDILSLQARTSHGMLSNSLPNPKLMSCLALKLFRSSRVFGPQEGIAFAKLELFKGTAISAFLGYVDRIWK